MKRRFETGQDLVNHIKNYINQDIKVDTLLKGKLRLGIVYMEIPNKTVIWSELNRLGIKTESHTSNRYFVYLA